MAEALADWQEQTITWATAPGVDPKQLRPISASATPTNGTAVVFDVTDIVRAWNSAPPKNFGFELSGDMFAFDASMFGSREGTAELRPRLDIVFNARTVSLPAIVDAHVAQAQPNMNFGAAPDLLFTTGPQASTYTRLLLRFDHTSLPAATKVMLAELVLNQTSGQWLGPADVFVVKAAWNEATVTWNNFPLLETTAAARVQGSTTAIGQNTALLGPTLTDWITGKVSNLGVAIVNDYEGPAGASRTAVISSSENVAVGSRPSLAVYYK